MICPSCGLWNPSANTVCAWCQAPLVTIAPAAAARAPGIPVAAPPALAPDLAPPRATEPAAAPLTPAPAYKPVPGPIDRESFFAAQHRYRRQTWRLAAVCALAAILTGIPLSLVLTPVIYAVILILTRLIHIVTPVPDAVWNAYERVGLVLARAIEAIDESSASGGSLGGIGAIPLDALLALAAVWLIPGVVLMLVLWPVLGMLFRKAGGEGVLLSLGTREPHRGDREEQQLVNVVEELAIAAGIPAPKVMLLDAPIANAAVIGSSPEDAVIVVTRRLLDDLGRDETQGVLAHLVASIGNGDLRASLSLIAIFQTFGFASALIRVPIDGEARRTVWRMLRYVFGRHRAREQAAEARAVSEMLTRGLEDFGEEDDFAWVTEPSAAPKERPGPKLRLLFYLPIAAVALFAALLLSEASETQIRLAMLGLLGAAGLLVWYQRVYAVWSLRQGVRWARVMIMLPYYIGGMMPLLMLMMLKSYMLEPLIGMLWRTRRYLADATAVQLTRNPDGLARGLADLLRHGGAIPGGAWAAPLFIVGAETANARIVQAVQKEAIERLQAELRRLDPEGDDAGPGGTLNQIRAFSKMSREQRAEALRNLQEAGVSLSDVEPEAGFSGSTTGGIVRLHPSLDKRLRRLQAMGASIGGSMAQSGSRRSGRRTMKFALASLIAIPFFAVLAVLILVALTLMAGLALFFTSFMMALVYALFQIIAPV